MLGKYLITNTNTYSFQSKNTITNTITQILQLNTNTNLIEPKSGRIITQNRMLGRHKLANRIIRFMIYDKGIEY